MREKLEQAKGAADFAAETEDLFAQLAPDAPNFPLVRVLLEFMEENPGLDYGSPGPLAHFVEKYFGRGFERELVESLERHATPPTTWMLNRLINGTKEPRERARLVDLMRAIERSRDTDAETRERAKRFLERLG